MTSYDAYAAYEAGRRRASAAAMRQAYQPYPDQSEYDRPHYEPGEPVMPGSAPYVPPTAAAVSAPQPQQPGLRRLSSYQPPPTAPVPVPQHPGMRQSVSYGQPTTAAGYSQQPAYGTPPYGTSPYGPPPVGSYGQQIPQQNIYPLSSFPPSNGTQRLSNGRPGSSNGPFVSPAHSDRYEDNIAFDEAAHDPRQNQRSRAYSRSSQGPSGRRLSAADAYLDEHGRRMSVQDVHGGGRSRRSSRHSAYESTDDDDDDLHRDRERRRRRSSKVSTHSKGSGHRKSSSATETRTYGDSMTWAYHGVKKLLSSKREP